MATRIVMSKLSPTMEEGRVLRWVKEEGDDIESGDIVVEVETDKANMEVEAVGSGILRKILIPQDTTVPTGTILGIIAAEDEDISDLLPATGSRADAVASHQPARTGKPSETKAAAAGQLTAVASAEDEAESAEDGRIKASPLARRIASERGIALQEISGSGPGGRIIRRDVETAVQTAAVPSAGPPPELGADVPFERVELSQIRKSIARNLTQSLGPVPHFYLTVEIDMGHTLELRAQLNRSLEERDTKVGVNEILIKAAAQALMAHPEVNASFAGDHIRRFKRSDIGVAVALPDGLITPVLRDAGSKGLLQISAEMTDLVARARDKKLSPEEYQGATFTISNLGMYGIDEFTAVINPPAATVLAVGATQEKAVVVDGSIEVRSRMRVTLSCDHRAVDGAMGADFLATFKGMLENPLRLVL